MKIYSMTATFGKLEHKTITFHAGLNIIEAPNEWGKSTWCAFLVAMLYGLDTRAHSTKTALADKERYAPWSGSPMSGRIDLNWNGRNITIERKTKGRTPLGDFAAYETASGLAVPELTAANCGQMLLGVEKNVFLRSGFIRLTDLPVTEDEALRRRLNALVTTGDESGTADTLAQQLKDLKNRCRFHKSGLLPQAEAQRDELNRKLRELDSLQEQSRQIKKRIASLEDQISQLENHKTALCFAAAQLDQQQVAAARKKKMQTEEQLRLAEEACRNLPPKEQTLHISKQLQQLQLRLDHLQEDLGNLPQRPQPPIPPAPFAGLSPVEADKNVSQDIAQYRASTNKSPILLLLTLCAICAIVAGVVACLTEISNAVVPAGLALIVLILAIAKWNKQKKVRKALQTRYGTADIHLWQKLVDDYAQASQNYAQAQAVFESSSTQLASRRSEVQKECTALTDGASIPDALAKWQSILDTYAVCEEAYKEYQRAVSMLAVTQAMAKTAEAPVFPDTLTYSEEETLRRLSDCQYTRRQLELRLGQCMGQMEQLGNEETLHRQLSAVTKRIQQLADTYAALSIAQQTLSAATSELQRRFAPRISKRTQELFSQMTGNRYDRLTLGEDLSLRAGTQDETTLHSTLWRSDGTTDQLYLALRLAVAEALTPDAPLILDDALVRFDDKRLAAAMDILRQIGQSKQILLFTCQTRETQFL